MRNAAVTGQRGSARWRRAVEAALTIILLSAVAVVGLPLFGSEVLAAWKTSGNAELKSTSWDSFDGLLSFSAPEILSSRFKAQTLEAEQNIQRADGAARLVKNWKYTQSPTVDALALSLNLYISALQAEVAMSNFDSFMDQLQNTVAASNSPFAPLINNALAAFEDQVVSFLTSFVNTAATIQSIINPLIPASLRPPPIPPASPCNC